jgi:hypothetical protein
MRRRAKKKSGPFLLSNLGGRLKREVKPPSFFIIRGK